MVSKDDLLTANLMDWVARYYLLQGAYKSAEILLRRELEIRTLFLGDEYPDTLNTMNNLAETLRNLGDYDGARRLHEEVLEIRKKVLGEEHPNTSLSALNLVFTLLYLGEPEVAVEIMKRHLLWLIDKDPADLPVAQQEIREKIIEIIGGENRLDDQH